MKRIPFLAIIMLIGSGLGLHAADTIGNLAYTQGGVSILRDGKVLSGRTVFNGMPVNNFDQIRVDRGGLAEVKLDPKTGIDATLKVHSASSVTMDITSLKSRQQGNIELIGGSLELKVARLTTGNGLNVKTGVATMGVRGTTFAVTIAPGGENLLTTEEGRVACETGRGEVFYAEPGNAVDSTSDGVWANNPVSVEALADFRSQWLNTRIEAFRADPARALRQQGDLFEAAYADFTAAFRELGTHRALIARWIRQDQQGNIGTTAERLRDKRAIIGTLMRLRKAQVVLERTNARILQLGEFLPGASLVGTMKSGKTLVQFQQHWNAIQGELMGQLAEIWYISKMYAARNEGSFPLDFGGTEPASNDSFFGTNTF